MGKARTDCSEISLDKYYFTTNDKKACVKDCATPVYGKKNLFKKKLKIIK